LLIEITFVTSFIHVGLKKGDMVQMWVDNKHIIIEKKT